MYVNLWAALLHVSITWTRIWWLWTLAQDLWKTPRSSLMSMNGSNWFADIHKLKCLLIRRSISNSKKYMVFFGTSVYMCAYFMFLRDIDLFDALLSFHWHLSLIQNWLEKKNHVQRILTLAHYADIRAYGVQILSDTSACTHSRKVDLTCKAPIKWLNECQHPHALFLCKAV